MRKCVGRNLLSALVLGLHLLSCAPSVVHFSEGEKFAEVFEDVPGTQSQLFLKANAWMTRTFVDDDGVIQHSDKEEGVVIGKYRMYGRLYSDQHGTIDNRVFATIDIRLRDNKARIEIQPQERWPYSSNALSAFSFSKEDARFQMIKLAESFYEALLEDPVEF